MSAVLLHESTVPDRFAEVVAGSSPSCAVGWVSVRVFAFWVAGSGAVGGDEFVGAVVLHALAEWVLVLASGWGQGDRGLSDWRRCGDVLGDDGCFGGGGCDSSCHGGIGTAVVFIQLSDVNIRESHSLAEGLCRV